YPQPDWSIAKLAVKLIERTINHKPLFRGQSYPLEIIMHAKKALITGLIALGVATPAAAEFRLGASLSATGPAGILGDLEARTLEMLVEEVNAQGGINGEKIRLFMYDDGSDANKSRTFATRLIEDDEVQAIIGGTTTGTSMSISSVSEEA